MMRAAVLLSFLFAAVAGAQPLDVFQPDDFVDPGLTKDRAIFISRVVAGYGNDVGEVDGGSGFVSLANSLYWSGLQIDYRHTETRAEDDWSERRPKDVLQIAWYQPIGERVIFRYQAAYGRQYESPVFSDNVSSDDHSETRAGNIEAGVRIGGRMVFGSFAYSERVQDFRQGELKEETYTFTAHLPLLQVGRAILTPRVQLGRVSNSFASADVLNPSLDFALPVGRTNVHFVYSPVIRHNEDDDSTTQHQIGVYVDRALFVAMFDR